MMAKQLAAGKVSNLAACLVAWLASYLVESLGESKAVVMVFAMVETTVAD